jgi:hypothetical protein
MSTFSFTFYYEPSEDRQYGLIGNGDYFLEAPDHQYQ